MCVYAYTYICIRCCSSRTNWWVEWRHDVSAFQLNIQSWESTMHAAGRWSKNLHTFWTPFYFRNFNEWFDWIWDLRISENTHTHTHTQTHTRTHTRTYIWIYSSCPTAAWLIWDCCTGMHESCHTLVDEAYHTCGSVTSHIWISLVTSVNASCWRSVHACVLERCIYVPLHAYIHEYRWIFIIYTWMFRQHINLYPHIHACMFRLWCTTERHTTRANICKRRYVCILRIYTCKNAHIHMIISIQTRMHI